MAGMGLVMLLAGSLWVVVPGLAATLWLLWRARQRRLASGGQLQQLMMLGSTLALTIVLVIQVALSDRKISRTPAVTTGPALDSAAQRRNDEVAGYAWASDGGLTRESECTTGNPAFRAGCRKFARAFGDTSATRQRNHATLRLNR